MEFFWIELIIRPLMNTLLVLYVLFFSQMGLAIIAFTILVRVVTLPLTLKQVRQMRALSLLAPKLKEIQAKYAKDRARVSQETMRMYKEAGVNPVGCLGPMIVQMPILFGLYQVLIKTLFSRPDDLVGVSEKIYPWMPLSAVYTAIPLDNQFLWLDLSSPDPTVIIFPLLVASSTWIQQKMSMTHALDPKQQSTQNMMLWMMPIMLGFFSTGFPSGLSLYWIISNVIGVTIQYFVTGWGPLFPLFPKAAPVTATSSETSREVASKEVEDNGSTRHDRPNRRGSHRTGAERARRRPRRGRGRSTK